MTSPSAPSATLTPAPAPAPGVQLVCDLVTRVPAFRDAYDAHVFCQGCVQPHIFFWDVVQATVRAYLDHPEKPGKPGTGPAGDWRRTLDFLEEQSGRGVVGVDEVIVTSFLGDLPGPHEPGHALVRQLGPVLSARFRRLRPGG